MPRTLREAVNQAEYAIRELVDYAESHVDNETGEVTPYHLSVVQTLHMIAVGSFTHPLFNKDDAPRFDKL